MLGCLERCRDGLRLAFVAQVASMPGTATDDGHAAAADSARPGPDHPAADLPQPQIKRRAILGGLRSQYQRAA